MSLKLPVALFETTITSTITSTATTIPLASLSDGQGSVLTNASVRGFIIDEGEDSGNADYGQEYIIGTVDTAGVQLTGCLRGVSFVDGITEVSANKKKHRRGASVKMTSHPYLISVIRALNGTDQFDADNIMAYDAVPALTPGSNQFATVGYADALAIAGAPDGAEATKGIFEAATQTESDEGDDTGSTSAPTVLRPSKAANSVQRGTWLEFTETASGDDAFTATTTPTFTPEEGTIVNGTFATGNTGACTFDLNGAGVVNIKKYASGALADPETGDIVASQPVVLRKTGSNWVLMNPGATMPTTALLSEMAAVFAATDVTGAELETLTNGSNAGAKHYHVAHEADASLFATGTIHLPMTLDDSTLVYAGANTAGSEIWSLPSSIYMVTGTNASNYGSVRTDGVGKVAASAGSDGFFFATTGQTGDINLGTVWTSIMRFRLNTLPSSTDTFFIGFAEDADTLDASGDPPTTSRHIGLQYHGAGTTWRVTTGDNTTQQTTSVSTPSAGWHELKFVRGASDVKVYLDGTLLATHSTNVPTQGPLLFYAAYNNGSGATSQTEILRYIDLYAATT